MQLNSIFRLKKYMSKKELEVVLNSSVYSNFNYCPLAWHFSTNKSIEKIENIHKRCLRLTLNDYKVTAKLFLTKVVRNLRKFEELKRLQLEYLKLIMN